MREMEHLATGIQLADENLGARPARFVTDEHMRRLEEIRAAYDPEGRFHSWMGVP
jgi:FAD/FMN-containing dehydrogenase